MSKINQINISGQTYDLGDVRQTDLENYTLTSITSALITVVNSKQDNLVSGTNIKTINNQSLLGSGNINIQGGGSGSSVVELTQEEYDNLEEIDPNTMYIITDAEEEYTTLSAFTSHTSNTDIHVNSTEKNNWNNKAEMSDIPTNVSELNNDAGYITGVDLSDYATTATTDNLQQQINGKPNFADIPTATSDLTNDSGFITNAALTSLVEKASFQYDSSTQTLNIVIS